MNIPIEDFYEDIISKACRGLSISKSQLAAATGLSRTDINTALGGELNESHARKFAEALGLDADSLILLGKKTWKPEFVELDGLAVFNTPFHDMTVNAFVVWDPESMQGCIFDSGADATPIIDFIFAKGIVVESIFITHTHPDHIVDLDKLVTAYRCPVYVGEKEESSIGEAFAAGRPFSVGKLSIETRLTWGHATGGITFVVEGLQRPLAVVGDALFAQSMGGGMVSYKAALETNRKEIFTLPKETVICPGHGPLTSVGEEMLHNPFFPEFK